MEIIVAIVSFAVLLTVIFFLAKFIEFLCYGPEEGQRK